MNKSSPGGNGQLDQFPGLPRWIHGPPTKSLGKADRKPTFLAVGYGNENTRQRGIFGFLAHAEESKRHLEIYGIEEIKPE